MKQYFLKYSSSYDSIEGKYGQRTFSRSSLFSLSNSDLQPQSAKLNQTKSDFLTVQRQTKPNQQRTYIAHSPIQQLLLLRIRKVRQHHPLSSTVKQPLGPCYGCTSRAMRISNKSKQRSPPNNQLVLKCYSGPFHKDVS